MKVVLDTNVIVSGLNFPGNERQILDLARGSGYDLYLSPFILAEVAGVLVRKFRWDETFASQAVDLLKASATMVEPRQRQITAVQGNEADNLVLACAVEASADYLVTGDRRHLLPLGEYQGTAIVDSARFLSVFKKEP